MQHAIESQSLAACQLPSWWPLFAAHTPRSICLPLPAAFTTYLSSDGVFLPNGSSAMPVRAPVQAEDSDDYQDWTSDDSGYQADISSAHRSLFQQPHRSTDSVPAGGTDAYHHKSGGGRRCSNSSAEDSGSDDDQEESPDWTQAFPGLLVAVTDAIEQLGGSVVPKLNWSCPVDACWVNPGGELACSNAEQVVLLLKSSDRIAHDLDLLAQQPLAGSADIACSLSNDHPASTLAARTHTSVVAHTGRQSSVSSCSTSQGCPASLTPSLDSIVPTLTLRKCVDIRPEREFRCFVRGRRLIAACQRDISQHYPQLTGQAPAAAGLPADGVASVAITELDADVGDSLPQAGGRTHESSALREIRVALWRLHQTVVRPNFPLHNYTYDVYITNSGKARILDFNPVLPSTSPLLFTWDELGLASHVSLHYHPNVANHSLMHNGMPQAVLSSSSASTTQQHGSLSVALSQGVHITGDCCSASKNEAEASEEDTSGCASDSSGSLGCSESGDEAAGEDDSAGSDPFSGRGGSRSFTLRVVLQGTGMQLGTKAACAMPFDMLQLQEDVEGVVARLRNM